MKVIQVYLKNNLRNFNYIVYSEKTKEAIFFDPMDISKTLPECSASGITPKYLVNTHDHFDHIMNNKEFLDLEGTEQVFLSHAEYFHLSDTEKIKCIDTPGHVKKHQCFQLFENDIMIGVITGDTVFNAGVGNCKDGGSPDLLFESIRDYFWELSGDVIIYPSHDYFLSNLNFAKTVDPENRNIDDYLSRRLSMDLDNEFILTTINEEKLFNPFFRVFNNEFSKDEDKRELFKRIRSKRDIW